MENTLSRFYNKIYNTLLLNERYSTHEYLYPMDIAIFNLAVTDFKSKIVRFDEEEIITEANKKYDNSKIILEVNITDVKKIQKFVENYGSTVVVKKNYKKIEFLSILTSFGYIEDQINFIEKILNLNILKEMDEILEEIKFNLSIDIIKYSNCHCIKINNK